MGKKEVVDQDDKNKKRHLRFKSLTPFLLTVSNTVSEKNGFLDFSLCFFS